MVTYKCCENHSVTFVREEAVKLLRETPLQNGRREYHKCLSCGADHALTFSEGGLLIDHRTLGVKTF